ncbi:DNA replication regulator SLD3-domain-containing protein [Aspergillus ambiguus]|uniref:uncharacterized protein n=1 Tax=Aspergillus ambiguus TaxID=176160 RepID=UPI003CCE4100
MASRGSLESIPPNPTNAPRPLPKKRKTCHTASDWADQPISIRPPAASLSDAHVVLDPVAVVPRSRLPLTWIDCSPTSLSHVQPGSLFVADIPILEADDLHGEPVVLAVRVESDGALYVVERVKTGVYALSKLVREIEEGDVFVAVKGWSPSSAVASAVRAPARRGSAPTDWWCMAQVEEPDCESLFAAKRSKVDVSVVFGLAAVGSVEDDVRMTDVSPFDSAPAQAPRLSTQPSSGSDGPGWVDSISQEAPVEAAPVDNDNDPLQSPQETLDNLREQYLQALYVSKTSVAYFAKGPLARCRAAFQSETESARPTDLIDYYREAILTAKKMDLKYRESVPATLQDALLSISDAEPPRTKRKSKMKKKLGKNGLYPEEDRFIRRWWKDRALTDHGVPVETSREAELKKHVSDLRMRETQLQILLILETLALEAAVAEAAKKTAAAAHGEKSDDKTPKETKAKSKKAQELSVMLELHLDRLCIWHAVSFEDTAVPDPAKAYNSHHMTGKKVESDAIRDFCTEVIIPFYASRLPDRCKSITRKLGVSAAISPFPKKSSRGEPGAAVERQPPAKHPRRSLHRVSTDERASSHSQRRSAPSLSRSSTAPSHVETKRESMEPLLPILSASVRGGIQKAKRVENREVDLNAVARQHETKLKKVQMLADQKKELDAAIVALRKPNRELVARDIADDADKRRAGSSGRKPKNPVRNPLGQGVQVAATPRGSRKKDVMTAGLPPVPTSLSRPFTQPRGSFFGGDGSPQMVVPGSASVFDTPRRDVGAIQETPTRRPARPLDSFDDDDVGGASASFPSGNLFRVPRRPAPPRATDATAVPAPAPSTPVSSRHVDAFSQPLPRGKSSMVVETPPRQAPAPTSVPGPTSTAVLDTPPVKKMPALRVPEEGATVPATPEKSIYAQLGWDNDELAL